METPIVALQTKAQRLQVMPELGGSIASWDWIAGDEWTPIFRPWNGLSDDRYTFACFPLVPWSNRITHGGFEQDGVFYPIQRNRSNEAYPIHGDGWLQAWQIGLQNDHQLTLQLKSHRFDGNPYDYLAELKFTLLENGLEIALKVTHCGEKPLPYGLGLHPYFVRNTQTLLQAKTTGVWLAGSDPIPVSHTANFPPTWDYNEPAPLEGPLIDNCFTGWDGRAVVDYPDRGFSVTMSMANCNGYSLMYRPPDLSYFCYEPITQPIDAFHIPHRPGLVVLSKNDSFTLKAAFTVSSSV